MSSLFKKIDYSLHDFAQQDIDSVFKVFGTSRGGLSEKEADRRLGMYGENIIESKKRFLFFFWLLEQLKDPVILILLLSSNFLFLLGPGYIADAYIILFVLIVNLGISLLQKNKVSKAFKLLNNAENSYALVIRSGKKIKIPSKKLVPGDVVFFELGEKVPADIRILDQNNLQVNESSLTGEWAAVTKKVITLVNKKTILEQVNMLWMGTSIVSGKGCGVVVKTGSNTVIGEITKEIDYVTETPLQKQIKNLAKMIMIFVSISVVIIAFIAVLREVALVDAVITSVAIAIAGIPSGLPVAITIVLAIGMQSILKNKGLVKNMTSAETLGSTTWILTDKTGTLTKGDMHLAELVFANGREKVEDKSISPFGRKAVFNSYIATDGTRINKSDEKGDETMLEGSSVEKAIFSACEDVCDITQNRDQRVFYRPFSSKNRYSSAILKEQSGALKYYLVGAPETILDISKNTHQNGSDSLLTNKKRDELKKIIEEEGREGNRVMAIALSAIKDHVEDMEEEGEKIIENAEKEISFLALLILKDFVREDVPESIEKLRSANIKITMVTGDNEHTALNIAKQCGIIKKGESKEVIRGEDLKGLKDEELFAKAQTVKVFARMLPDEKSRLLRVILNNGEVVGMTGDGVNDIPALHRASIGIAVESGTDVAKEAADLILLKNSFQTITAAVIEGKKIIRNLKKIIIYLLSTSFSEVVLVSGGLIFTSALPILPVQILWANIVEEALIAFAFAFEKSRSNEISSIDQSNKQSNKILTKNVRKAIIILSITTGTFLLITYAFFYFFTDLQQAQIQTIMFIAVSIDSIFLAISLKRLNKSIFKTDIFDNMWLVFAIIGSSLLIAVAFYAPILSNVLSLTNIPLWALLIIPVSGMFHIFVIEVIKERIFKKSSVEQKWIVGRETV